LPEFAESLVKFFCMVKKRNGDLFPSDSLKAMFRAFARILQFHYKRLAVLGSYNGPIVDASKDALFEKARLACIEAMKHSLAHGANQKKRKRTIEDHCLPEEEILQHPDNEPSTPQGLSRRICYYAIHKFNINGDMELYNTTDVEFQRILNEEGKVFWQRKMSKYLMQLCKAREIPCTFAHMLFLMTLHGMKLSNLGRPILDTLRMQHQQILCLIFLLLHLCSLN
jgi:hypothetical protein